MNNSNTLKQLSLADDYQTTEIDPIENFYLPCLKTSSLYLRAAGYFRSSVLHLIGPSFVEFAKRDGKAFLVCSHELSADDIEAIAQGRSTLENSISESLIKDLEKLYSDEPTEPITALATLVSSGALQIFIATRPGSRGIFHAKIGCFIDQGGNQASFIGSANESYSGWSTEGNFESIEVFCSWKSDREAERTYKHKERIENLINGTTKGLRVVPFPIAAKENLIKKACDSLDECFPESTQPIKAPSKGKSALPHQRDALQAWENAGHRGILKHATGSGKTFTAIMAIAEHVNAGNPAIVLVPSQLLQTQWTKEIKAEIPDAVILEVGGGHQRWRDKYTVEGSTSPLESGHKQITVAVMATASKRAFINRVTQGDQLLIVADEVHQVGSQQYSEALKINAGKRLGLSATPERYGDQEGTEKILDYFGDILKPEITLLDAINVGRLVPYEYYPSGVKLEVDEAQEWKKLTKRIGMSISNSDTSEGGKGQLTNETRLLLIKRARILKRARGKAPLASEILRKHYREGQRWLIYCEDSDHMDSVSTHLEKIGVSSTKYHSGMKGNRHQTLSWFDDTGGVVLAVRCLDEGIDIPSVSHALILASSQNPRQFIQRRGRILRKAKGKSRATLFDALVMPPDDEEDPFGALEAEFTRALEFAQSAVNVSAVTEVLHIADQSRINITRNILEYEEDELNDAE